MRLSRETSIGMLERFDSLCQLLWEPARWRGCWGLEVEWCWCHLLSLSILMQVPFALWFGAVGAIGCQTSQGLVKQFGWHRPALCMRTPGSVLRSHLPTRCNKNALHYCKCSLEESASRVATVHPLHFNLGTRYH